MIAPQPRWRQTTEVTPDGIRRFEEKFIPEPNTGCWLWIAGTTRGGYGEFRMTGRLTRANRVAWMIYRGPIPPGLFVLHRCDTPACVNPDHLFLGTQKDNSRDMVRKGRHGALRAEARAASRFTWPQINDIRARYASGEITQMGLAREYRTSSSHIHGIVHGRVWRVA